MAQRRGRKPMAEINVVPYIDVMLVLLVIFMVTAPLLTQGVQVDLPRVAAEPISDVDEEPLIVSVSAEGNYFINVGSEPKAPVALADIEARIAAVLRRKPQTPVLVWGDTAVPYGLVVELMTRLQSAGAPGVGLVTENPGPAA